MLTPIASPIGDLKTTRTSYGGEVDGNLNANDRTTPSITPTILPDTTPGNPHISTYEVLMASVDNVMGEILVGDQAVLLMEITTKMQDLMNKLDKLRIEVDADKKRAALAEKNTDLQQSQTMLDQASAEQESAAIWDKVKLAFQWLGAVLAIVGGALLALTGNVVAGALLIAASVTGILTAIDSSVKAASPEKLGIAGQIARNEGKSLEEARTADQNFSYAMIGITAVLALASIGVMAAPQLATALINTGAFVASRGLQVAGLTTRGMQFAAVGEKFVNAGKVLSDLGTLSTAATTVANTTLQMAGKVVSISESAVTAGTAIGEASAAGIRKNAADHQAQGQEFAADAKELEALLKQMNDIIDELISRVQGNANLFNSMIDGVSDALNDAMNTLSSIKFAV